ncbi:MAG: glycosyltransferase family 4 protein [Flavobacteriaceae bacterium]
MKTRKKILFVIQLPPPVHGASMVNKMISESLLVNTTFQCKYINLTTAKDVKDIGKGDIKKLFRSIVIWIKAVKTVMFNRYDLVYMTLSPHGPAFYKDGILALLLKIVGARLAFHLHGKGVKENSKKGIFKKNLYKWVFRNVEIIHLSPLLYFDINHLVDKSRVCYVPNGIPNPEENIINKKHQQNNILYLSNLQESKGSFTLVQAARILKEQSIDFKIDFVGKWHNDPYYKQRLLDYVAKYELVDRVSFHGPRYGKEKQTYFQNASFFVLPTKNDCFPLSILEAMSHELPVVSTRQGAIPEIVEDNYNGFLIDENDPKDLADALARILSNESLRKKMGANSFSKFAANYTVSKFENNFVNVLNQILEKHT